MIFGILGAFLTAFFAVGGTILWQRKKLHQDVNFKEFLGPKTLILLIPAMLLMWLLPYGIILILPFSLALSTASPAARNAWKEHRQTRLVFISLFLVTLLFTSMLPVGQPRSPAEWGEPMFTENPNAPLLPASEQHTWLLVSISSPLDAVIIQSMVLRVPYQYGPMYASTSMLQISSLFGLEQGRLEQAILLLDERVSTNLDPDEMNLDPLLVENKHVYPTNAGQIELDVRVFDLRSLALGIDPKGGKVGHVVIVADSRWGGEVDMLVVVRPVTHSEIDTDPFAERYVGQWLDA
jgi:hypothetical protein